SFGSLVPNRYDSLNSGHRYGFQGQEKDDEIKGEGNSLNYTFRMHDPRVGRFFTIDPLSAKYPHNSPYAFSENRVLDGVELEGLEVRYVHKDLNTNDFKSTLKLLSMTQSGKKFDKLFLNQKKIDILYYPLKSYWGEEGMTNIIRNKSDFDKLKSGSHRAYYQNLEYEHVKLAIEDGKELILIGTSFSPNWENEKQLIDESFVIRHEETAHAIKYLKGKVSSNAKDHGEYNFMETTSSPSNENLEKDERLIGSPAQKDYTELKKVIKENKEIQKKLKQKNDEKKKKKS
ncbi:RHS repeat domain-containing protein, partial [Flavobacterium sp.]|uniref:RHS repeat domain-containing protein n=1 Tax=Flavobacterium sp. TaxID=239 RepID=UPI00391D29B5